MRQSTFSARALKLPDVTKDYFSENKRDFTIIDIRTSEEYVAMHIPGSVHVSLDDIKNKSDHLPLGVHKRTAIFHCRSGMRTKDNEAMLIGWASRHGFKHTCFIGGGIQQWKAWGFETTNSVASAPVISAESRSKL